MEKRSPGYAVGLGGLFFCVCRLAFAQPTQIEYAWNNGADFRFGHTYGATVNASAETGEAALTTGYRQIYQIPLLTGTGTFWTALPITERLPKGVGKHAVVAAGDYLYVIAGRRATNPDILCGESAGGSEGPPIARVYFTKLNRDGSLGVKPCPAVTGGCWQESFFEYGQRLGDAKGLPVFDHQALAVQNAQGRWRVYVSGGNTMGSPEGYTQAYGIARVFSALQDPLTGELGPWEEEIEMAVPASGHSMVYAGGALFVFGGRREAEGQGMKVIQRADILGKSAGGTGLPNTLRGSLNPLKWDTLPGMPPGTPAEVYNLCCQTNECGNLCSAVACSSGTCPDKDDDDCREEVGWVYMNATAVMRSFMMLGGAYISRWNHSCNFYPGGFVGHLDDCNVPSIWRQLAGTNPAIAFPAMRLIAHNDVVLGIGSSGDNNSPSKRAIYNIATMRGIYRDAASPDGMDVRPGAPNGIELLKAEGTQREVFAEKAIFSGLVAWKKFAYVVGLNQDYASQTCNRVYRASLPEARDFCSIPLPRPRMETAYYLSPPYDLHELAEEMEWAGEMPEEWELKRVSWRYQKNGGAGDDWAMVRYRVANGEGDWSYEGCAGGWAPRTPVDGTLPAVAGEYEYSSDLPDSDVYYQPRFTNPIRYIQFEVSLYNDAENDDPVETLPVFKEFKIVFAPASFKVETELPECPLEVYPNPAADSVTLAFGIDDEGGELVLRVYNVAGNLVAKEELRYTSGGPKRVVLDTSQFAPGVYILNAEGKGAYGGGVLRSAQDEPGDLARRSVSVRFVIRR